MSPPDLASSASRATTHAPPSVDVDVAAFIRKRIGDPGRPVSAIRPSTKLGHLPGQDGLLAGIRNLVGLVRGGADHLRALGDRYGTVFRCPFGPVTCVGVTDPELVREIGRNADRVWSAALGWRTFLHGIDPSRRTIEAPMALDFAAHQDIRRLYQPGFSLAAMNGYVRTANAIFDRRIDRWIDRGVVEFKHEARRMFATVANEVFVGVTDPQEAAILDRAMTAYWAGTLAFFRDSRFNPVWRRAQRAHRTLERSLTAKIEPRRRSERDDLFSHVCRAAQDVDWVDDASLVSSYLGLMIGAFDTTSMAVTSMAYALAADPQLQQRVRDEVLATPAEVDSAKLRELQLTDRVWRETLRRYPVAPDLPRMALRDTTLGGHRIPAGAFVLGLTSAVHLDPALWTDPTRFDPERFSPERAEDKKHKGSFLPFGIGPHACIGAQLSSLEAKSFWHRFLRRARFRLRRPYRARHRHTPLGCVSGRVTLVVEPLTA